MVETATNSAAEAAPSALTGARVIFANKHVATIRYVGPVQGQKGEWAGLEWDDPTRGKHDGSHEGVRYFTCVHHPNAGSFVRLPKVLETANFGQTLEQAIAHRYKGIDNGVQQQHVHDGRPEDGDATTTNVDQPYACTASNHHVPIQLVGVKQAMGIAATDGRLLQVGVSGLRVSSVSPTEHVRTFLSRVKALDLADNLLTSWSDVVCLASALPALRTLDLSGNLFDHSAISSASLQSTSNPAKAALECLVMNRCKLTWPQALVLASAFPCLQELHVCGNDISKLTFDSAASGVTVEAALPCLTTLDLEDNALASWQDICATLKDLPSLRSLLLSDNRLRDVCYAGGFSALSQLALGSNSISSWQSINELQRFPVLCDLRVSDNPLTRANPSAARYEVVARVGGLRTLNGSDVSHAERWDAELCYLRRVLAADAAPPQPLESKSNGGQIESVCLTDRRGLHEEAATPSSTLRPPTRVDTAASALAGEHHHPRLQQLIAKYGHVSAGRREKNQGTALKNSMAELLLIHGTKEVRKPVPVTLTIGRLKPLLERLLGVKTAHQVIVLVPPAHLNRPSEDVTREDGRDLRFYGVGDGWKVQVSAVDVAGQSAKTRAERAAAEARRAAAESRHEMGLQRLRAEEERLMVLGLDN